MKVRPVAGEEGAARESPAMKVRPVAGEEGGPKGGGAVPEIANPASPVSEGVAAVPRDRLWPVLITVGLLLVVLVNVLFTYIAVKGADGVVPSYFSEER